MMNSKLTYAACSTATAVILTAFVLEDQALIWGQEIREQQSSASNEQVPIATSSAEAVATYGNTTRRGGRRSRRSADSEIRQAVQSYQAAKSDEDKQKATESVSAALSEYFEADMKDREQDIKEIEQRVQKLRDQLQKRRSAKEKIVDLQLKVMLNEAEGLGFYGRSTSGIHLTSPVPARVYDGRTLNFVPRVAPTPDTPSKR